jgi:hypothetical protein
MAATLRIEQLSAKDVRRLFTGERQRFTIARAGSGVSPNVQMRPLRNV